MTRDAAGAGAALIVVTFAMGVFTGDCTARQQVAARLSGARSYDEDFGLCRAGCRTGADVECEQLRSFLRGGGR